MSTWLDPALSLKVLGDNPPDVFGVQSFQGDHDGLRAELGFVRLFPYSRFPGFASQRGAVYGATLARKDAKEVLDQAKLDAIAASAVSLLPPGVREATVGQSSFPKLGSRQTAFRTELVGDMILDCGHPPIHAEIHPYRAGIMHVTPPPADFAGFERVTRYSLFSWVRQVDAGETLAFDVWPPPRSRGKTKIVHKFLLPDSSEGSGFVCTPWPAASPNRLRRDIAASDVTYLPGNADVCEDNPRMLPSCATSLAGGLDRGRLAMSHRSNMGVPRVRHPSGASRCSSARQPSARQDGVRALLGRAVRLFLCASAMAIAAAACDSGGEVRSERKECWDGGTFSSGLCPTAEEFYRKRLTPVICTGNEQFCRIENVRGPRRDDNGGTADLCCYDYTYVNETGDTT